MNKFTYRLLIINTKLKTENETRDYDDVLLDEYVKDHLYYTVEANLGAKSRLAQPRSWRLPLCIYYRTVEIELDCLSDGALGCLGAGACLFI